MSTVQFILPLFRTVRDTEFLTKHLIAQTDIYEYHHSAIDGPFLGRNRSNWKLLKEAFYRLS